MKINVVLYIAYNEVIQQIWHKFCNQKALPLHIIMVHLMPTRRRTMHKLGKMEKHLMCATVAFGMGINKPNVRFIIHLSIPQSLECYAQEFGRAGRDGEQATSCILFRFEDRTKHLHMISSLPEGDHRTLKLNSLNEMVKFCIKPECRRHQLLKYFGECLQVNCDKMCDFCMANTIVEKTEANVEALEILSCLNNMKHLCNKLL